MKKCNKCGIEKDTSEFQKYKRYNSIQTRIYCRPCLNEMARMSYQANKNTRNEEYRERKRRYQVAYRSINKDKLRKNSAEYHKKNVLDIKEKFKKRYQMKYRGIVKERIDNLHDTYVAQLVRNQGWSTPPDVVIEIQKCKLKILRLCKNTNQSKTYSNSDSKWQKSLPRLKTVKLQ